MEKIARVDNRIFIHNLALRYQSSVTLRCIEIVFLQQIILIVYVNDAYIDCLVLVMMRWK